MGKPAPAGDEAGPQRITEAGLPPDEVGLFHQGLRD